MIPLLATPAGAATTQCQGGQYPNRVASESRLTVDCTAAAGTASNNIEIHDADNAVWHHGAARVVALTCAVAPCKTQAATGFPASTGDVTFAGASVIKWNVVPAATATVNGLAPGAIDVHRPISAVVGTAEVFAGGTYIVSVNTTTRTAVISQPAKLSEAAISLKIEHTTNRALLKPTCTASSTTITMPTTPAGQTFAATDVGKSASGGGIPAGDYIVSESGANATLNVASTGTCIGTVSTPTIVEIGAETYVSGSPVAGTPLDPMDIQLSNTSVGGTGFSCAAGVLHMNAATFGETGGFVTSDIGLNVQVKRTVGAVVTTEPIGRITAVSLVSPTTATLSPATACPTVATSVINSTNTQWASVGVQGAGAPVNNAPMMTLGAELNLNPALVATQDACAAGTLEGFMVVGGWVNPGAAYAANSGTPTASVAEIGFPTSVITFDGWVVPHKSADVGLGGFSDSNPHYAFSFPILPTGTAECTSAPGIPLSATGLEFTINPITYSTAPFLPTGSGNIGDPSVRTLLSAPTSGVITEQQINNTGPALNSSNTTTCTLQSLTDDPILGTGAGCPTT